MNSKGFTLIELLGVIVILAIILIITVPNVIENLNLGKKNSYSIMLNNIITASKVYYEECEYGDTIDSYCTFIDNSMTITLQDLVSLGFLTGSNSENGKVILEPINKENIGDCEITITKSVDINYIVTYTITSSNTSIDSPCPITSELENGEVDDDR